MSVPKLLYAHSVPGRPTADWEPLAVHAEAVAAVAARSAAAFKAEDWG